MKKFNLGLTNAVFHLLSNGQLHVVLDLLVLELFASKVDFYRNLYYVEPFWELLSPHQQLFQLYTERLDLELPNAVFHLLSNGQHRVLLALLFLELFTSKVHFYRILDFAEFPWWPADPSLTMG
jgi:hypothetical protein